MLDAEAVAVWYLRLNGFLLWPNFILHQEGGGGQRTECDAIGVRFPHRRELDDAEIGPLEDDPHLDFGSHTEVVLADATLRPCKINASWLDADKQNIERALKAVGCLPPADVDLVACALRGEGSCTKGEIRLRLLALGSSTTPHLARGVVQVTWEHAARFLHHRFSVWDSYKRNVRQWDETGTEIQKMVRASGDNVDDFCVALQGAIERRSSQGSLG